MKYGLIFLTLSYLAADAQIPTVNAPVELKLTGDWELQVTLPSTASDKPNIAIFKIPPAEWLTVESEKYQSLPIFKTAGGAYARGTPLIPLRAQETSTPFLLDPSSLVLRAGSENAVEAFVRGQDYEAELTWACIGRLANGRIKEGQAVYASYRHGLLRLDSIVLTGAGKIAYRPGQPQAAAPLPPALADGERRLANVWLPGPIAKLTADNLFPILETTYPEPPKPHPTVAERLVPKALKKLQSGEPLRILAWGDSVTAGGYVPDADSNRWQAQFVARLRERFPQAKIELVTEAWGGRNTGSYLAEPPGSVHNYREKVLGAKPELIISEFVNDAGLKPAQVEERYAKLLADFQQIGAEWIILTPHYTRPDWMGLNRERDIDQDPRPYVQGLREFTAAHGVALADASLRYGRLWRQGLPYSTLLLNSINHPNARGLKLFADALLNLFP
jgi:lysophospholipase L1-like esterase